MLNLKFSNASVMGTNEDTETGIKSLTGHSRTVKKKKAFHNFTQQFLIIVSCSHNRFRIVYFYLV